MISSIDVFGSVHVWFWIGTFLSLFAKVASNLWTSYREVEEYNSNLEEGGKLKQWVCWKRVMDFFFKNTEAAVTTILTFGVGWAIVAIWVGDVANFIGSEIDVIPKHPSIALVIGLISESLAAPVSGRVAKLIVGD